MTNRPCRSITPTTAECDQYIAQIELLAAKAPKRKRWYLPSTSNEGDSTVLLYPSEIPDD
jgi:hypothetical protein